MLIVYVNIKYKASVSAFVAIPAAIFGVRIGLRSISRKAVVGVMSSESGEGDNDDEDDKDAIT